jgi:hypothetical protein
MFFLALGLLGAFHAGGKDTVRPLSGLLAGLAYIALAVGTVVLHEAVHGLLFWLFGGRPRYGIGVAHWVVPYAYATSPGRFTLPQMTIIGLAPAVILSLASLVLVFLVPPLSNFATVVLLTNLSGAAGDLWMVRELARFRHCQNVWTVDAKDGIEIYSEDPAAQRIVDCLASRDDSVKTRLIWWWLGASLVIMASTLPLMILLTELNADRVVIGPSQFPLFLYERTPDSFGIWIDYRVGFVAGLLFALLRLLFDRCSPEARKVTTPKND